MIAVSLGCLQYILEEGVRDGWFDSAEIIFFTIVSASSGILLIYRELTIQNPVIDFYAFKNFNFAVGCIFSFIIGLGLYVMVYLLPLQLGVVRGLNSLQIGMYVTITGIFQFFSAPIAGFLSKKMDLRIMLGMGFFMFGMSALLNSAQTSDSAFWEFFLPQALRGLSLMLCFLPINSIALGTLPVSAIKNASGIYNLMRNLGGAIGLAVFNTFWINWTKESYGILRQNVTATSEKALQVYEGFSAKLGDIGSVPDNDLGAVKLIYQMAQREATVIAFNNLYLLLAIIFFLMILAMPFLKKVNVDQSPTEAH
ncbi:MFS transporter [Candidatus Paracaedibacter symbiosus]|uniref:MFS transporter n=1 Tax=Candidatus Paracaedibacter symbiosus TaxID=244582 RepID=UPI0018DCC274|nr:MFS transporter [Candidatus Paracaedibacter symbiosus]